MVLIKINIFKIVIIHSLLIQRLHYAWNLIIAILKHHYTKWKLIESLKFLHYINIKIFAWLSLIEYIIFFECKKIWNCAIVIYRFLRAWLLFFGLKLFICIELIRVRWLFLSWIYLTTSLFVLQLVIQLWRDINMIRL